VGDGRAGCVAAFSRSFFCTAEGGGGGRDGVASSISEARISSASLGFGEAAAAGALAKVAGAAAEGTLGAAGAETAGECVSRGSVRQIGRGLVPLAAGALSRVFSAKGRSDARAVGRGARELRAGFGGGVDLSGFEVAAPAALEGFALTGALPGATLAGALGERGALGAVGFTAGLCVEERGAVGRTLAGLALVLCGLRGAALALVAVVRATLDGGATDAGFSRAAVVPAGEMGFVRPRVAFVGMSGSVGHGRRVAGTGRVASVVSARRAASVAARSAALRSTGASAGASAPFASFATASRLATRSAVRVASG
jgi:hypothetical protein